MLLNFDTNKVEEVIKLIRSDTTSGLCPKSFQQLPKITYWLRQVYLCMGGYSGQELVHLPYDGTILDQPNIFIQVYETYVNERNIYNEYIIEKEEKEREAKRQ